MAFVLAGLIAAATLGFALLQGLAVSMSDAPGVSSGAGTTLAIGLPLAALVAASHWLPHIGW